MRVCNAKKLACFQCFKGAQERDAVRGATSRKGGCPHQRPQAGAETADENNGYRRVSITTILFDREAIKLTLHYDVRLKLARRK